MRGICWCCRKEALDLGQDDLCFPCWYNTSLVVAAYLRDLEEFAEYRSSL